MKKTKDGQAVALSELIALHGGPADFGKLVGEKGYNVSNWKILGKVPLNRVGEVARALKVSIYLLNYNEVSNLNGDRPSWKAIVDQVGYSKKAHAAIMSASEPTGVKSCK